MFRDAELTSTTPLLLSDIIRKYPGIDFVAAHMGGLAAPPEEIFTHLVPSKNLYLDTSNAAHTLSEKDFLRLLEIHGPEHIIFGTDWPWFDHKEELNILGRLLNLAIQRRRKEKVFYKTLPVSWYCLIEAIARWARYHRLRRKSTSCSEREVHKNRMNQIRDLMPIH
jgi:hypothetical protein